MMYKVVESNDRRGIIYEVIVACGQGWEPQGGICVSICTGVGHRKTYHQAVIKKDKKHCTGPA